MSIQTKHNPINILFTACTFLPNIGGSELGLARLVHALSEHPDVGTIVLLSPHHQVDSLKPQFPNIKIIGCPDHVKDRFFLIYELVFAFKLLYLCIRFRIDVLHCHWANFPAHLVRFVSFLLRRVYVITVCGGDVNCVEKLN